ncbi:hypothetical protein BDR05DRAFT_946683 [Suillus weaverae]|nr:hypothetical protein BDR05DRAFT_946683 [Suillus weaverae]
MLPPAVQNFLDLSSDPDLDGYQADIRSAPTKPTPTLPIDNPSSMTEPESKPEIAAPTPTLSVDDPSSMTEPESEPENPPQPTIPAPTLPVDDLSSVTEPESEPENLPQPEFTTPIKIKGATPVLKKKGFFNTPSPSGPDSLYWKYVSHKEDEKWDIILNATHPDDIQPWTLYKSGMSTPKVLGAVVHILK